MVPLWERNAMTEPVRPPSQDELDPIEIAALQLTRLQATLRRAYDKVPHYKRCFDEAGVSPADLTSLDDLARFPFAVKDDPRLNYPFDMFAVPREQVMRIHASSGTAGTPTVVGYTSNDSTCGPVWSSAACAPPARAPATRHAPCGACGGSRDATTTC